MLTRTLVTKYFLGRLSFGIRRKQLAFLGEEAKAGCR